MDREKATEIIGKFLRSVIRAYYRSKGDDPNFRFYNYVRIMIQYRVMNRMEEDAMGPCKWCGAEIHGTGYGILDVCSRPCADMCYPAY